MKIIIVGAGQVGFHIASRLAYENKDVVVIDTDPEAISQVSEKIDVDVIVGSGSSPMILEEAGIKEAEILLAVTDSDETNLVACLMADILSSSTKKLARIRKRDYDEYHHIFHDAAPHIDTIINPEIEVVKTIERFMSVPGAVDVGEFADGRLKLIGIFMDKDARLAGVRLSGLSDKIGTRTLVAAVVREGETIIPRGDDRLYPGDLIYFISEEHGLEKILKAFNKHVKPINRAMIVGGGRIGLRLAKLLESQSIYTKLIERSPERCSEIVEQMNKVLVVHGDGSDQSLLNEENIQDMDVVVTLTDDEETNILVSLLAKKMGARKTITKLSKFGYFSLMSTIGLEQVVSPRLSAINTILQHIRRGKVLSARTMTDEQAEVLEAIALETSDIVGKPLKRTGIPKGALVIGIIRDDEIEIPSGNSVIKPNDRIIIFARRQVISKIEKILTVKLEFF
ncbi:MAG: Trk system potassium transporter TrkA [Desulfobacteraceae bacterium]|nr:Trk system potassium transporter TrkA [Desulfobacteraceae bacterium]MBC2758097.1 Trk system potassium transporter TrkA [Desulfobacteraceae bacterium]